MIGQGVVLAFIVGCFVGGIVMTVICCAMCMRSRTTDAEEQLEQDEHRPW